MKSMGLVVIRGAVINTKETETMLLELLKVQNQMVPKFSKHTLSTSKSLLMPWKFKQSTLLFPKSQLTGSSLTES